MKSVLLSLLFLIAPVLTFSQENDKTIYFDSSWKEAKASNHTYYRVIKDYSQDKEFYAIEDYYKSGKLQMTGKSSNREKLVQEDEFTYYFENGNKKIVANYKNGVITGKYSVWYEDGSKQMEGEHVQIPINEFIPTTLKIHQFWNPQREQTVIDANGFYDAVGAEESDKGHIKDGLKDGEWTGSNKKLNYTYKETYKNGTLVSGESIDKNGKTQTYIVQQLLPTPKNGMQDFRNYLGRNYKAPYSKEDVDGSIILNFVVEKDGKVNDIEVAQSLGNKFDREAIKVLKSYDEWLPGKVRGIPVRVSFSLPIRIKVKS